jgi:hypothetical protein
MQIVRDPRDLSGVLELLHGRWFSADDVVFDPHVGVLSVSLARRASEEAPLLERSLGWLYRRWRTPLRETVLRVHRVTEHVIDDGHWRLEAVGYHSGVVALYAAERPVVRARVEELDLDVEETPSVVGERVESCALGFLRRYEVRRFG